VAGEPPRAYEVEDAIAAWVQKDPLPKETIFNSQRFEILVKDVMYNLNKSTFGNIGRRNGHCYIDCNIGCIRIKTVREVIAETETAMAILTIAAAVAVKMKEDIFFS